MNQSDKNLLLKDLCARVVYDNIIIKVKGLGDVFLGSVDCFGEIGIRDLNNDLYKVDDVRPYLRPMSSMTAEEEYEYHQCKNIDYLEICEMEHAEMLKTTALCFSHAIDWLNKNGFDYRGLIPMGLALEAPKDMYKTE